MAAVIDPFLPSHPHLWQRVREQAPDLQLVSLVAAEGDASALESLFVAEGGDEDAQPLEVPVTAVVVSLAYAGTLSRLADMMSE